MGGWQIRVTDFPKRVSTNEIEARGLLVCGAFRLKEQVKKYHPWSVAKQEEYVMSLVESGSVINSLEWNAAHVKLMEMQSQEALAIWAQYFFDSIVEMGASQRFRVKPCPVQHMSALIP